MSESTFIPVHRWKDSPDPQGSFKLESWGKQKQDLESLHPHRHEYHEIMFFLGGLIVHDIDFRSYESRGREIHFVQSNSVHMLVREDQAEGLSLMFTSDFADGDLLSVLPFGKAWPVVQLNDEEFRDVEPLLLMIVSEYRDKRAGYMHVIRNYFHALLWKLARKVTAADPLSAGTTPDIFRKFQELLSQRALELRTVDAFAQQLHVSPKHLIEVVKQHSGRTPLQLIHDQFLSESKRMLYHTDKPIKEIAFALGFTDGTNFTKWFKSKTGYTPQNYRTAEGK